MNFTGIQCTLLMGATVPLPLSAQLTEAVRQIEVSHSDEARSGFQITFAVGRNRYCGQTDYGLLQDPQLQPFNRVIILLVINALPRKIMDGIITHIELNPQNIPSASTLIITGEDISVMMDREEKIVVHPAQNEVVIANKLIAEYAQYQLIPEVIAPPVSDTPNPLERIPTQHGTDRDYLESLAERYAYIFYVAPGPEPFTNTAYWGPPKRIGLRQKALSVNFGPATNVTQINFQHDALVPTLYQAILLDEANHRKLPIQILKGSRKPLSRTGAAMIRPNKRFRENLYDENYAQALALLQAQTDKSTEAVVIATGEVDMVRYGDILQVHGLVAVRGAGTSYDGEYYVKEVTQTFGHSIYRQQFTLTRDGTGTTLPTLNLGEV
jgi:hypothetical protein